MCKRKGVYCYKYSTSDEVACRNTVLWEAINGGWLVVAIYDLIVSDEIEWHMQNMTCEGSHYLNDQICFYHLHMPKGYVFVLCVCLLNEWTPQHRNFIFGMVGHLDHIKFEYQGHWVKVKGFLQVITDSNCECLDFYHKAGGGPSSECILVDSVFSDLAFWFSFFGHQKAD